MAGFFRRKLHSAVVSDAVGPVLTLLVVEWGDLGGFFLAKLVGCAGRAGKLSNLWYRSQPVTFLLRLSVKLLPRRFAVQTLFVALAVTWVVTSFLGDNLRWVWHLGDMI